MQHRTLLALVVLAIAACGDPSRPLDVPHSVSPALSTQSAFARRPQSELIPQQYIVVFRESVADPEGLAKQLVVRSGGNLRHVYSHSIKGFSARLPDAAVVALQHNPAIAYIEQDQRMHVTDIETNSPWGLDRVDQHTRPVDGLYHYSATGSHVYVYVFDTGVRLTHTDFGGRAFTGIDEITPGGTAVDCNGHGTNVAGIVGGNTYGVAKGVTLYSVRVLPCQGPGSNSDVIAGVDWVSFHQRVPAVVNMSLGGGYSDALNSAIENSIATGVTYVVAAGNNGTDACFYSPASTPDAITVGATDASDVRASFSNWGQCVDIFAPGVSITSDGYSSDFGQSVYSGTSQATPHVTGTAALFLQNNPQTGPAGVAQALFANATLGVVGGTLGGPNRLVYSAFVNGLNMASLSGPSYLLPGETGTYTATVVGGVPPYTFRWTVGGQVQSTTSNTLHYTAPCYPRVDAHINIAATVTDAHGATSSRDMYVTIEHCGGF